jgi:hypothetical protein
MPIRPLNPQTDMERIIALYRSCFAEPPWFERFDPRELEAEFREILSWSDTIFLVEIDENGAIIGVAIEQQVPDTRVLMSGEIPF